MAGTLTPVSVSKGAVVPLLATILWSDAMPMNDWLEIGDGAGYYEGTLIPSTVSRGTLV